MPVGSAQTEIHSGRVSKIDLDKSNRNSENHKHARIDVDKRPPKGARFEKEPNGTSISKNGNCRTFLKIKT